MWRVEEEIASDDLTFRINLDHEYPEHWTQSIHMNFKKLFHMIPMVLRYLIYYVKYYFFSKKPIMDFFDTKVAKQMYGCPIGGIGSGTIGRGFKGEFCRFQLIPGIYEYNTVYANQFIIVIKNKKTNSIFQSVLSTFKNTTKTLSNWKSLISGSSCKYFAAYPRAWTEYDLSMYGIKLICRQTSPIIPHDYQDSSLPCAVFNWLIENESDDDLLITIAFTFKNGTGSGEDSKELCLTKEFKLGNVEGVTLKSRKRLNDYVYVIGSRNYSEEYSISTVTQFDPKSNGSLIWDALQKDGNFKSISKPNFDYNYGETGIAVATQINLAPKRKQKIQYSLTWHMPQIYFKDLKTQYRKYYTGLNLSLKTNIVEYAIDICCHASKYCHLWDKKIYSWQTTIEDNIAVPQCFKRTLFNELYYVADGGSIWIYDKNSKYGKFAYLEGHEYRMYNTVDVHFYASFALLENWPELQLCIQSDLTKSIDMEVTEYQIYLLNGDSNFRKVKNTCPHDFGDPENFTINALNAYNISDVSKWKDLNLKYIIQIYRDYYVLMNDSETGTKFLSDAFPKCYQLYLKCLSFDVDGDSMIENNSEFPDQTYDLWHMQGTSAYCGGLWLAALYCLKQMAEVLKDENAVNEFSKHLQSAKNAYITKLWNGRYYNFDCSPNNKHVIMADQLCGFWYLIYCGNPYDVFSYDQVKSTLKTIYEFNIKGHFDGMYGAVNGFKFDEADSSNIQSEEVWIGVVYALISCMLYTVVLNVFILNSKYCRKINIQIEESEFKKKNDDFCLRN